MSDYIQANAEKVTLQVHVQPKSSQENWGDVVQLQEKQWIQLRISAPPVDGAANEAIVKKIAKTFGTAKSNVSLIKGEKSRYKTFIIEGFKEQKLQAFLRQNTPASKT